MGTIITYNSSLSGCVGGINAAVMMAQLEYWFKVMQGKAFYKFLAPCEHEHYKEGDSWVEELGISISETRCAFRKIGIVYKSKRAFIESKDRFQGKFYASYYDRMRKKTYYFRNDEAVQLILEQTNKKSLGAKKNRGNKKEDSQLQEKYIVKVKDKPNRSEKISSRLNKDYYKNKNTNIDTDININIKHTPANNLIINNEVQKYNKTNLSKKLETEHEGREQLEAEMKQHYICDEKYGGDDTSWDKMDRESNTDYSGTGKEVRMNNDENREEIRTSYTKNYEIINTGEVIDEVRNKRNNTAAETGYTGNNEDIYTSYSYTGDDESLWVSHSCAGDDEYLSTSYYAENNEDIWISSAGGDEDLSTSYAENNEDISTSSAGSDEGLCTRCTGDNEGLWISHTGGDEVIEAVNMQSDKKVGSDAVRNCKVIMRKSAEGTETSAIYKVNERVPNLINDESNNEVARFNNEKVEVTDTSDQLEEREEASIRYTTNTEEACVGYTANNEQSGISHSEDSYAMDTYYTDICQAYNEHLGHLLGRKESLSDKEKCLAEHLRSKYTVTFSDINKAFQKTAASSFLCGKTAKSTWKASLTWLLKKDNLDKVLAGNYNHESRSLHQEQNGLYSQASTSFWGKSQQKVRAFNQMESHYWDFDEIEALEMRLIDQRIKEMNAQGIGLSREMGA